MQENTKVYDHLEPIIENWPIHDISLHRRQFVEEVRKQALEKLKEKNPEKLFSLLERVVYSELIRANKQEWRVDPPKQKQYWSTMKKKLFDTKKESDPVKAFELQYSILFEVVDNYAREIIGAFDPKTYRFARFFLTNFFGFLLSRNRLASLFHKTNRKKTKLYNKLKIYGDIDLIRSVAEKGTVVLVPTHSSNLDSTLLGYIVDSKVGIPSFSYGAGLNLYNFGPAAYFMNRLGAYRVDRRKKNAVYLEVLKTMSETSIVKGVHTLFFPGGTRSRSGHLEEKLKLGLLNTTVEAQRSMLQDQSVENSKVFIVPVVLNYHFVLEAKYLIRQHLSQIGKERYDMVRDMGRSKRKILKFIWEFYTRSSEIFVSFGDPMDVFGNRVLADGSSLNMRSDHVDLSDYFLRDQEITRDHQRESEYTKHLSEVIIEEYKKVNLVLSSTLLSYVAFKIYEERSGGLDVFDILFLPKSELVIEAADLADRVTQILELLKELEEKGELRLSEILVQGKIDDILEDGLDNLGLYHTRKPMVKNRDGDYVSHDLELLYFYHNRMPDYGLDKHFAKRTPVAGVDIETYI